MEQAYPSATLRSRLLKREDGTNVCKTSLLGRVLMKPVYRLTPSSGGGQTILAALHWPEQFTLPEAAQVPEPERRDRRPTTLA